MSAYHASSKITLSTGDKFLAVEWVDTVIEIMDRALADGGMMKLEKPSTPAGEFFYVKPSEIVAVERAGR